MSLSLSLIFNLIKRKWLESRINEGHRQLDVSYRKEQEEREIQKYLHRIQAQYRSELNSIK